MLPFAGIPSFARSPLESLDADWKADVGVLGVPFDIALGYRPGAALHRGQFEKQVCVSALPRVGSMIYARSESASRDWNCGTLAT
jgi:hypothetical protein